jgi:hypothetical protein
MEEGVVFFEELILEDNERGYRSVVFREKVCC